jgi:hypothetical protein
MWATAEDKIQDVQKEMDPIIKRVERIMNKDLSNTYRSG